ncbi:hypothetical protein CQ018_13280 [Arthrobacter sp. MYb227]|nr:hypothetical protein CQ018_13280 [Arthrobacter sp. MYb227]
MIVSALFLCGGGVMLVLSEGKDLFLALGNALFGLVLVTVGYLQLRSGKRDAGQGLPVVPVIHSEFALWYNLFAVERFCFHGRPQ